MSEKPGIKTFRAGKHYPGRDGWEWEIGSPARVVGWRPTRLGAWLRARSVRHHPEQYPIYDGSSS